MKITTDNFFTTSDGIHIYFEDRGSGLPIVMVPGFSRGTAQAKAVLFFILVATIGLLQLSANRKKEVQQ